MELPKITTERRSGNTTRLADYYVQEIFNNPGKKIIIDDHTEQKNQRMNEYLFNVVSRRLEREHQYDSFKYDKAEHSIMLIERTKV